MPQTNKKTDKKTADNSEITAQLVVLGAGPGGYTAAFRAADLGLKVVLIERYPSLGGVCLNVGCIPSKALLHVAGVLHESAHSHEIGVQFGKPVIDLAQTRSWKAGIVTQLTNGLAGLAKKRKVEVIFGSGKFIAPHRLQVTAHNDDGNTVTTVNFKQAIIAAGSAPIHLSALPNYPQADARIMDSTDALKLEDIPKKLLVIGGGIIGLEMATMYHALGSQISVVEMMDGLMAGTDADLVRPLFRRVSKQYENIWLNTKVTEINALKNGIQVSFDGAKAPKNMVFDKVLVSVGRSPNGARIGGEAAGIEISKAGFIPVDDRQRTNVPHIFAIGDLTGQPMLAHKAVHEGKVAAEVAADTQAGMPINQQRGFEARVIPSVAYTDPEVAWVGITEIEAKQKGLDYGKGVFPWAASGRALSQNAAEGTTKLLFDRESERIIGAGITGRHAGDLINEAALAIEMNADAEDIALTIHAHPTLAETLGFAAEVFGGTITDLYLPKKR